MPFLRVFFFFSFLSSLPLLLVPRKFRDRDREREREVVDITGSRNRGGAAVHSLRPRSSLYSFRSRNGSDNSKETLCDTKGCGHPIPTNSREEGRENSAEYFMGRKRVFPRPEIAFSALERPREIERDRENNKIFGCERETLPLHFLPAAKESIFSLDLVVVLV